MWSTDGKTNIPERDLLFGTARSQGNSPASLTFAVGFELVARHLTTSSCVLAEGLLDA